MIKITLKVRSSVLFVKKNNHTFIAIYLWPKYKFFCLKFAKESLNIISTIKSEDLQFFHGSALRTYLSGPWKKKDSWYCLSIRNKIKYSKWELLNLEMEQTNCFKYFKPFFVIFYSIPPFLCIFSLIKRWLFNFFFSIF